MKFIKIKDVDGEIHYINLCQVESFGVEDESIRLDFNSGDVGYIKVDNLDLFVASFETKFL